MTSLTIQAWFLHTPECLWHQGGLPVWEKCRLILLLTATNLLCAPICVEICLQSYNSGIMTPTAAFVTAWSSAQNVMTAYNLIFKWHYDYKQHRNMPWWKAMWNLFVDQFLRWFTLVRQDLEDLNKLPSHERRNRRSTSRGHTEA